MTATRAEARWPNAEPTPIFDALTELATNPGPDSTRVPAGRAGWCAMSAEWKPGDVAMVTLRDGREFQATRYSTGSESGWYGGDGLFRDGDSHYSDTKSGRGAIARPLVVIDAEDRDQVERLWPVLRDARALQSRDNLQQALREFAGPTPPKPDEPMGLGAVVEDDNGIPWVRCENVNLDPHWYARNEMRDWSEIQAVRVLSEGVVTP